jgi:hypothetical protein
MLPRVQSQGQAALDSGGALASLRSAHQLTLYPQLQTAAINGVAQLSDCAARGDGRRD